MVNLKYSHVFPKQTSAGGEPYIKFRLVFRKTNKDPNKCMFGPLNLKHLLTMSPFRPRLSYSARTRHAAYRLLYPYAQLA